LEQAKTFELTIHPEGLRSELIRFLEANGIEDYVEAASDSIDADDVDWEEVLADWSEKDDSPLLIYKPDEKDFEDLKNALTIEFGDRIRFSGKWISDSLWQEAWQSDFQHLETEQFFISSPEFKAPSDKIHILLKEAAVFGSGQHATTQALVRLMEAAPRYEQPRSFLDIGTGTGVLAFVAHHLGYSPIVGTDIEDNAIENAEDNARLNHIPLILHLGSQPPEAILWDTIACNILPPTLTHLLEPLSKLLKDEGSLYLAGFHEANSDSIEEELKHLGFAVIEERKERGWIGWLAQRQV
jgi:ribosomal protein L11 methyltransferase